MKRALRSGADEILFMPLDPGEATRALLKVSEARWRTERRRGRRDLSVISLVGGVGVTSLAANLALALQSFASTRRAGRSRSSDRRAGGFSEPRSRSDHHAAGAARPISSIRSSSSPR